MVLLPLRPHCASCLKNHPRGEQGRALGTGGRVSRTSKGFEVGDQRGLVLG